MANINAKTETVTTTTYSITDLTTEQAARLLALLGGACPEKDGDQSMYSHLREALEKDPNFVRRAVVKSGTTQRLGITYETAPATQVETYGCWA